MLSRRSLRPLRTGVSTALAALLIAGLAPGLVSAQAPPGAAAAPAAPTPPGLDARSLPFAMPGFKEQEFNGALLVGQGQSRFSLSFDLLTKDGKVIDENMVPSIEKFGPVTPDGSYYEIQVTTGDRVITQAKLDALQTTIDHPEDWSAEEVAAATAQLPGFRATYEAKQRDKRTVRIRYSVTGAGEIVGAATALTDDTTVFLQASPPWAEPSSYLPDGDRSIVGTSAGVRDAAVTGHFRLDTTQLPDATAGYAGVPDMLAGMVGKPANAGTGAFTQRFELTKGETVTFRAQVGDSPTPARRLGQAEILRILDKARAAADTGTLHGSGPTGQAATYLRDAMSLNENWDEKYDRSFIMWGLGGGGDDIFLGWDSGWDAITATNVDPATALDHIRDFYDQGGPRYDQLNAGPMHAYAAWRAYTRTGDRSILDLVYPKMAAYIARMPEFDTDKDGLLESPWVEDRPGGRGNHLGLDDSPQYYGYVEIPKVGGTDTRQNTNLTDVALNSYYGLFADTLARMATELGRPAEAASYQALHAQLAERMNSRLWNADRGLYLNRYLDGSWEPTVTPTVFYPLFGGLATPARAATLVKDHLQNPAEFGGEYVIPSVARNDPAFCAAGDVHESSDAFRYFQSWNEEDACEEWQGAAWPPMNATVYDGLKRYGFDAEAATLASKSTAMWLTTWKELGWFPEYFDAEPGQLINSAATDTTWRTYSWSNLMPLMSTSELIGDEPWGSVKGFRFGTLGLPGRNTVENVPLKGHLWSVSADARSTLLRQDGRIVVSAIGGRIVARDAVIGRTGGFTVKATAPTVIIVTPPGALPRTFLVRKGTTTVRW
ncbi:Bacterial alpha-L-rhamnosidase [Nakamurella sp. YIM 132087]|uniref:Bacterial alpha-L-rhamnosidase n=1 Tax=Nakamurella alba TaxID=2665158 RepID=A0A7K1FIH3_9ACTN|nr:trehalase family glycosidase [Nakamurella alba]MTD13249.1 Bacterial alpha-L-rhamnosidase [Nakamurella alba]